MDPQDFLNIVVQEPTDWERPISVKDYLKELMIALIKECELFDSKRPFGNEDWNVNFALAIESVGIPVITRDSDGEIDEIDWKRVDSIMEEAIRAWQ